MHKLVSANLLVFNGFVSPMLLMLFVIFNRDGIISHDDKYMLRCLFGQNSIRFFQRGGLQRGRALVLCSNANYGNVIDCSENDMIAIASTK